MHLQCFADFERAEANVLLGENTLISQVEDIRSDCWGGMSYVSTGDGCKWVLARNSLCVIKYSNCPSVPRYHILSNMRL
jgi:hypothetical protein